jgi:toxin ParE1/3/4
MPEPVKVRWNTPAAQDPTEIADYIGRDSSEAARKTAKAIFDAANSLDLMPNRGRAGRERGTRELIVPGLPYIIVYQVTPAAIHILRIFHASMNWL